jgi:hypothetical protein
MFRDSSTSSPLRYTETMVSRPSKTSAAREEEDGDGEGKVVL